MAENDPSTTDPDGRLVVFDAGTRLHLSLGRPELVDEHELILGTVAHPETPDGHAIHYDENGAVIGLTLLNVRHILERDGRVTLTLPPEHVEADALEPVLAAA